MISAHTEFDHGRYSEHIHFDTLSIDSKLDHIFL